MAALMDSEARLADVRAAIAAVRDPEIDETVADLDFIVDVSVDGGDVSVSLKLPTFWCPVNFVWLMAEDMRKAVLDLPWATGFRLNLVDHFAEAEISRGVSEGQSFETVFPKQAAGALGGLKRDFAAKGMLMRQGRLIAGLRKAGLDDAAICAASVATIDAMAADTDLQPLWQAVLEKRAEAELPCDPGDPAICAASGAVVDDLAAHMREIRRTGTNAAANGEMCRMLVAARREGAGCGAFAPRPDNKNTTHQERNR